MNRKRNQMTYTYKCSITGKKFIRTKKVNDTEELVSVKAYYELNPDKDDRPEKIKKEVQMKQEEEKNLDQFMNMSGSSETEEGGEE